MDRRKPLKMGKLLDRLEKQLKTEFKQDGQDCLKIYHKLKEIDNGHVWESNWLPLVDVQFIGNYPYTRRFKPTQMGRIFLAGIKENL